MQDTLSHLVPNVGLIELKLYPPADEVYAMLSEAGEITRLAKLQHIGALAYVYPGLSHSRWDYTVSMLYVIGRLRRLVSNSEFTLGTRRFSSVSAALQCLALISNVGHLPGTYPVEKGVSRFLLRRKGGALLHDLFGFACPRQHQRLQRIVNEADSAFREREYLVLNRLCGLIKLLTNFHGRGSVQNWLALDLYAPFILPELREDAGRWRNLEEYFDASRRLAYLNMDATFVGSPVTVGFSPLLSNLVDPSEMTHDALLQSKEITSAFEHAVWERFYHAQRGRKATAIISSIVMRGLSQVSDADALDKMTAWMYGYQLSDTIEKTEATRQLAEARRIGSVSFRSFFLELPARLHDVEEGIESAMAPVASRNSGAAVSVSKYEPPALGHYIAPDHVYIDAFLYDLGEVKPQHVGILMRCVADRLDNVLNNVTDSYALLTKPEVGMIYEDLLKRLVEVALKELRVEVTAWPLSRLRKFKAHDSEVTDVPIWLAAANLSDSCTKHIVRNVSNLPSQYDSVRKELGGLSQLCEELRKSWKGKPRSPQKRHFLLTASIKLFGSRNGVQVIKEFDGGILQVSARNGGASLYVLETKGAATPAKAGKELEKKLAALGVKGSISQLENRSAYAKVSLQNGTNRR